MLVQNNNFDFASLNQFPDIETQINKIVPFEIFQAILSNLSADDLDSAALVSQSWQKAAVSLNDVTVEYHLTVEFAKFLENHIKDGPLGPLVENLGQSTLSKFAGPRALSKETQRLQDKILKVFKELSEEEIEALDKLSQRPKELEDLTLAKLKANFKDLDFNFKGKKFSPYIAALLEKGYIQEICDYIKSIDNDEESPKVIKTFAAGQFLDAMENKDPNFFHEYNLDDKDSHITNGVIYKLLNNNELQRAEKIMDAILKKHNPSEGSCIINFCVFLIEKNNFDPVVKMLDKVKLEYEKDPKKLDYKFIFMCAGNYLKRTVSNNLPPLEAPIYDCIKGNEQPDHSSGWVVNDNNHYESQPQFDSSEWVELVNNFERSEFDYDNEWVELVNIDENSKLLEYAEQLVELGNSIKE